MKKCQFCGHGNNDDMRFCLECGKALPDAPIVFNLQDSGSQSGPGTNPYGQSQPTNFGGQQQQYQQQFSMIPPAKPRSNKKLYIAVAGIFALIFMVVVGVGGIIAYNMMKSDDSVVKNSPSPEKSPDSSPEKSPKKSVATPRKEESETPEKNTSDARATFEKIWVDYNVREDGRLGMRIHTRFTVFNLKDSDLYLALYFQMDDGTPLETSNTKFSSESGQTAVFRSLKPAFDEAYYEDVELFMPYDEFNLKKGKHNLKIDADVIYKDGSRLDHLDYYEFEYEKF
jgi:hypothetical protein